MPEPASQIDEVDRQMVHALQIAPRISRAALGEVVGRSAATVAQRWHRLEAEGLAWLVAYESLGTHAMMAFVTVECALEQRDQVIESLCADPRVMSVAEGAHASRLHAVIAADGHGALTAHILDRVTRLPGVRDVHARFVARLLAEGATWRLDALDFAQRKRVVEHADGQGVNPLRGNPAQALDPAMRQLMVEFVKNPRVRISHLSESLGRHETTVRRQVSALLSSGAVTVRCEMDFDLSGWRIERSWFLRVPESGIAAVTAVAREYRGLRLAALAIGDANVVITAFSRTLEESVKFEGQLLGSSPGVTVTESVLHLRTWKRMYRRMGRVGLPTIWQN